MMDAIPRLIVALPWILLVSSAVACDKKPEKTAFRPISTKNAEAQAQWSIGYYLPSSAGGNPSFTVSDLQMTGLTHIIHYAVYVNSDGTLDLSRYGFSSDAATLVAAAHASGVKALVGLGAGSPSANFTDAITNHLSAFVTNIMTVVNTYGFDGVDIDWEGGAFVVGTGDGVLMASWATAMRTALGGTKIMMAAVFANNGAYWAATHTPFDRINAMTYDCTGTSHGFLWFNAPIYDQASGGTSLDNVRSAWLASGFPADKFGLGIPFYGHGWTGGVLDSDHAKGISGPREVWQTGKAPTLDHVYRYGEVLPLIGGTNYVWDSAAVVPYLSSPGTPATSWYLTYDNPGSIAAKTQYITAQGLGGWIIWYLGADYLAGNSHPQPLLDAVAQAMADSRSGIPARVARRAAN
jgi:chitinase